MKNYILLILSIFLFGCSSEVTKVTWDDPKSIALNNLGKQSEISSGLSSANLLTDEAIFLLSYKNFEPIKIQSKQKSFVSDSALAR